MAGLISAPTAIPAVDSPPPAAKFPRPHRRHSRKISQLILFNLPPSALRRGVEIRKANFRGAERDNEKAPSTPTKLTPIKAALAKIPAKPKKSI
ncbi:MAG: hypothetical protein HAW59_00760 [Betaproteobacteria bacterium]|nr:hypothetical protein [Betaproteobacteria bacterium]